MRGSLEPNYKHQSVPNRNNDEESDDGGGDTACNEVLDMQVALAGLRIFHHDSS